MPPTSFSSKRPGSGRRSCSNLKPALPRPRLLGSYPEATKRTAWPPSPQSSRPATFPCRARLLGWPTSLPKSSPSRTPHTPTRSTASPSFCIGPPDDRSNRRLTRRCQSMATSKQIAVREPLGRFIFCCPKPNKFYRAWYSSIKIPVFACYRWKMPCSPAQRFLQKSLVRQRFLHQGGAEARRVPVNFPDRCASRLLGLPLARSMHFCAKQTQFCSRKSRKLENLLVRGTLVAGRRQLGPILTYWPPKLNCRPRSQEGAADLATEISATNSADDQGNSSYEIEFALVLSRMIDAAHGDPAQLRNSIYELARVKLRKEVLRGDVDNEARLVNALDVAIRNVEIFSKREDQSQRFPPARSVTAQIARQTAQPAPVLLIDQRSGSEKPLKSKSKMPTGVAAVIGAILL